ncbi:uncharacterized protein LOC132264423 [Phlebotomus argentipes]|uniref:uncharacterized protein LOC132264423 n=1 Tax=Phlebotomus argentipes TaxID=94469 RepID=UPI00289315CE|nr:uncharacterized protein LOC132264423 [Phlebotomus argentipes]
MLPLEVVRELVDYSVLRFDCNGINSYVLMMLKWFLGSGMMLQVADILLLSAKIDLAEEKVQQCKSKLFYYMAILQLDKLGNCEWLESWQKQENATLNSVMETPWHDIQSACAFFSHHKKDCECLLCLQYKTEDVSCQMNLFFMWMLFIERQYDRVRDIHQSVAKANGTLQPVQPYELKTRAFFASALAQLKTPQSALKEFLKLQQISESMRSHRTALYQGFELQILSVKHLMNSNQATTKGKTMFEERLEMCSPNDSGKKVVKGKERKSKLPVKKERQPKVEKKEEISSGQVKRTTRSSNRN